MKRFIILALVAAVCIPAVAQKRAFTLADLYKIRNSSDPQFSPDGKKIAFVLTESFLEKGKTNQEIYLMDADGDNCRNVTNNPAADNHPRWSPDGSTILFLSTRENGQQAWLMPADGGTPRRLTDFAMGVDGAEWSPDGKQIVFSADVFPDCGADNACNKLNDSTQSTGPIQAHLTDKLLYRHWTAWKDGKVTHTIVFDIASQSYRDITPGTFESPSWEMGAAGFTYSPDGREICFVSNHDRVEAESTNKDLWIVPSAGGTARNITIDNKAYDGDPAYSPDGKYIAYKFQTVPGFESDLFSIAIYDRAEGTKTVLTTGFDNWVNDFKWAPDSRSIYFTGQVEGHVPLYRVDLATKKITKIIDVKSIDAFDVSPDGKTIVLQRRSISEPVELWSCSSSGRNLKQLTFFNKNLADEVDLRPVEELWIPSPTGARIHTFLIKPHNFDPAKKYPVILNVHGGPQSQWADGFRGDWQMYPGSGYIEAFPNPHGSTGYGEKFTAEISRDWAGQVYQDVMAVADSLQNLPYVDKDRMGAMGWSYGGYFMMWLEGHTTRFKAIVSMMGVYDLTAMHGATEELWFPQWDLNGLPSTSDLYQKLSPNNYVKNFKTPCLVLTGEKDFRVPYTQSLEFFTDLQQMGVPSRLIVFPNDGHWPNGVKSMPLYYNAHLDWFHTYLGGDPAPYDMTKMVRNQAFMK
ncbi:MAG TPA: S9 family peptidase [Bacteroidota bacterium]|nr:S9 family peptidase [Bacteroidota bacterium]